MQGRTSVEGGRQTYLGRRGAGPAHVSTQNKKAGKVAVALLAAVCGCMF